MSPLRVFLSLGVYKEGPCVSCLHVHFGFKKGVNSIKRCQEEKGCGEVGVMWSQGLVCVRTRAAEFCTALSSVLTGSP